MADDHQDDAELMVARYDWMAAELMVVAEEIEAESSRSGSAYTQHSSLLGRQVLTATADYIAVTRGSGVARATVYNVKNRAEGSE